MLRHGRKRHDLQKLATQSLHTAPSDLLSLGAGPKPRARCHLDCSSARHIPISWSAPALSQAYCTSTALLRGRAADRSLQECAAHKWQASQAFAPLRSPRLGLRLMLLNRLRPLHKPGTGTSCCHIPRSSCAVERCERSKIWQHSGSKNSRLQMAQGFQDRRFTRALDQPVSFIADDSSEAGFLALPKLLKLAEPPASEHTGPPPHAGTARKESATASREGAKQSPSSPLQLPNFPPPFGHPCNRVPSTWFCASLHRDESLPQTLDASRNSAIPAGHGCSMPGRRPRDDPLSLRCTCGTSFCKT